MTRKTKEVIIILLPFLLLFATLPLAAQTASVKEGCIPLTVNFTAPSGTSTYYWNFKDGVTSNLQNPTNIFNKAGTFNVEFRAAVGGPLLGTVQIKVYPNPVLAITVPPGCAPYNALLTNSSTIHPAIVVSNYVWVYKDGSSSNGVENPTHMHPTVGNYDVSFGIETQFPTCNKTAIFKNAVQVIPPPVASFTTNPANPITCNNSITVGFTNTSTGTNPLKYAWNLGNGTTSTNLNPPAQTYPKGSYTATLQVDYKGFSGCTASASKSIGAGKPTANIIATNDSFCLNSPINFKSKSAGIKTWNFGAGVASMDISRPDSVFVSYNTPGIHQVILTVTSPDGLCSDTKTFPFFVENLTASITSTPTFICSSPTTVVFKGSSNSNKVKYYWEFTDGKKDSLKSIVNKKFVNPDTLYYSKNEQHGVGATLTVISKASGCKATASITDTLWLPNALFTPLVSNGCAPLSTVFTDSSTSYSKNKIVSWKWIFGDGAVQTNTNSVSVAHTYTNPGEYQAKLIVVTERGCTDTSYVNPILVGKDLSSQLNFISDKTSVCLGETFQLTAQPTASALALIDGYHFIAENNTVSHCYADKTTSWSFDHVVGPQNVDLMVDYNGCFSKITKPNYINVKGAVAKINYLANCTKPYEYAFASNSLNATTLNWNFGDASSSATTNPVHNYLSSGAYTVTLTASNSDGCPPTIDREIVYPKKIKSKIIADSLLCVNVEYPFDGQNSIDVNASCHSGYTWEFPDMNRQPYTTDKPISDFAFPDKGVYTIRLIATDINGCKDTSETKIKLYDISVKLSATDSLICTPATISFSDLTTSDTTITKWNWKFIDGGISSLQNPSHSYLTTPSSNTYAVELKITDALGCEEKGYLPINFYKPISTIQVSDPALCLGESVTISATDFTAGGSNLTFDWNFGDSQTSTAQSNVHLYAAAQNYTITLNIQEISTGCQNTIKNTIGIQDYPVAGISTNVDSLKVLCAPQNVFFSDSSISNFPLSHQWDFGNGQTSTGTNFGLFYPKGTFTATHIVTTSNGCSDTTSQKFFVFSPIGDFSIDKNTICKGDSILFTIKDTSDVSSYTWAFGDGTILDDQSPVRHTYSFHPPSGIAPARLVVRGFDGICPVEVQKNIAIHEVVANFIRDKGGNDTTICFNDGPFPLTNTSTMMDVFHWDFGDGTTSTSNKNPRHQYAAPGVYPVTLSIANTTLGCKDTITKLAVVYPNPDLTAIGDTVCQGTALQLSVLNPVGVNSYVWTPSAGLSSSTVPNPTSSVLTTTDYLLVETNPDGCTDEATVRALVIQPLQLNNFDTSIVIGDPVTLPVYGESYYIFDWSPKAGLSCLQCNFPVVTTLEDAIYKLTVTDPFACFTSNFTYRIHVRPETFVKLPTMFTPNGDGNNDILYARGWGVKTLKSFQIFNRWGQMVFSSTDMNEGWDGTFNGELQSSDVYAYKVIAETWRNTEIAEEGFINLVR